MSEKDERQKEQLRLAQQRMREKKATKKSQAVNASSKSSMSSMSSMSSTQTDITNDTNKHNPLSIHENGNGEFKGGEGMDCFVADAPRNDGGGVSSLRGEAEAIHQINDLFRPNKRTVSCKVKNCFTKVDCHAPSVLAMTSLAHPS